MQSDPHVYPPLGPLYIAAVLKRDGNCEVDIHDMTFENDLQGFHDKLEATLPDVVGIQAAITTRNCAREMIRAAKRVGVTVIVGGPDPTVSYANYLKWGADIVVLGEGEETCLEIVRALHNRDEWLQIHGIAFLDGQNGVVKTPPRAMITDLDRLPFPAYELVDVEPYLRLWKMHHGYAELHIVTSRGCPFTCSWCSRAVFGKSFRQRSPENVIDEMVYLRQTFQIDRLWIADDTFALDKRWLARWNNELRSRNISIPYRCMTRIDRVDNDLIVRLKATGCYEMHLGVESGSQRILDSMQKRITVEQIQKASKLIKSSGIKLGMFIMFGYVGERASDVRLTEKLVLETCPDSLGISIAYPVPGTQFYEAVKNSLAANYDDLWEKTGENYQLMFNAAYPQVYYRNLIRYLLEMLHWKRANRNRNIFRFFRLVLVRSVVRSIETLWGLRTFASTINNSGHRA